MELDIRSPGTISPVLASKDPLFGRGLQAMSVDKIELKNTTLA